MLCCDVNRVGDVRHGTGLRIGGVDLVVESGLSLKPFALWISPPLAWCGAFERVLQLATTTWMKLQ